MNIYPTDHYSIFGASYSTKVLIRVDFGSQKQTEYYYVDTLYGARVLSRQRNIFDGCKIIDIFTANIHIVAQGEHELILMDRAIDPLYKSRKRKVVNRLERKWYWDIPIRVVISKESL